MKKNFLKFVYVMCAVAISGFVFSSCSKDDNGGSSNGKTDPSTIASSNLIVYLPFDGNAKDVVGNRVATPTNVTYTTGQRGQAYQGKDGAFIVYKLLTNDKLRISNGGITTAMWVKSPQVDPATGGVVFMQLNGGDPTMSNYVVGLQDQGTATPDSLKVKAYLFNMTTEWQGQGMDYSNTNFPVNKWFHLVVTYDNNTSSWKFYSNGNFLFANPRWANGNDPQPPLGGLTLDPAMSEMYIGAWRQQINNEAGIQSWQENFCRATLDELRVYNRALTDDEVKQLYAAEVTQLN